MPSYTRSVSRCLAGAAVFAGLLVSIQAQPGQDQARSPAISDADREFLVEAVRIAGHELQMGKLAVEHGTNSELKKYAQTLVDDYTLASAEVEALARLKGVALPNPPKPDTAVAEIGQLSGLEFDQAFVRQTVSELAKIAAVFEKEEQSPGADPDIQGFARSLLPKIRAHLQEARTLKL